MELKLKGKRAVVCAASKGLGFGAAYALAKEGARTAIVARGSQGLQKAKDAIASFAEPPIVITADMVNPQDRVRLIDEAREKMGGIDILVNNAGGPPPGPFESHGAKNWQLAFELALGSASHLCSLVLEEMKERRFGRIVNIVSMAALEVVDGLILSSALRPAVLGFSKAFAREVADHNILINSICPGIFKTDRIEQLAKVRAEQKGVSFEESLASFEADIPVGQMGDPNELGRLVAFLASPENTYLTGAAIPIDGGKTRRLY